MSLRIRKTPKTKPKRERKEKWEDVRKELYQAFIDAGITRCELQWEGCTDYLYLTFAHSLRRRKIAKFDNGEHQSAMRRCIRACQPCHQVLDSLEHNETEKIVEEIIRKRLRPVKCET